MRKSGGKNPQDISKGYFRNKKIIRRSKNMKKNKEDREAFFLLSQQLVGYQDIHNETSSTRNSDDII
jgi:hypothetical protein